MVCKKDLRIPTRDRQGAREVARDRPEISTVDNITVVGFNFSLNYGVLGPIHFAKGRFCVLPPQDLIH